MKTKNNTQNMNMHVIRNIVYSSINKMTKNIFEIIELDKELKSSIDINMKNAINKILYDYRYKKINS